MSEAPTPDVARPLIALSGVCKTYQMGDTAVRALDGVSLAIEPGELVAIMGPSGSGKSTLMHVLGLLDPPDSGSYRLHGQEVAHMDEDELAALRSRTIGFVFQQFNLLSRTSAAENVALPMLYAHGRIDPDAAVHLLARVGLAERSGHRPNELSGGQQQRVAIARALINKPSLILADEPTGNLDSTSEREIMALLAELNQQGITVIIVTHEPEIARYVRRVIRMRDGKVQSDEVNADFVDLLASAGTPLSAAATPPLSSTGAGHHQGSAAGDARRAAAARQDDGGLAAGLKQKPVHMLVRMVAHLTQAWRSLVANKVRTVLSMLGILIGVAAVITMLALGRGAEDSLKKELAGLGSNLLVLRASGGRNGAVSLATGAGTRLSEEDGEAVKAAVPTIKAVSASVYGQSQIVYHNKNWNTEVEGVGPAYASMHSAVPPFGRFFTETENRERARVAVIGATVVHNLFGENQNPIGESVLIDRVSFQVIGILPVRGAAGFRDQDDTILIPVDTAMHRLYGKPYLDSLDLEAISADAIPQAQEQVIAVMNRRHHLPEGDEDHFEIYNLSDIRNALSSTSRIMAILLATIASISLFVGGIGIMNIMLVSVTERTREIGLRKAVGATRGSIRAQFLVEATVISLLGGLLGIALGVIASAIMTNVIGWSVHVSLMSVLVSALFSAGIGVLFGYWPARKASALSPIDALRHE